jgi:FkbH-like protein
MGSASSPEKVRLLIWDLDETFWSGTLAEGGIRLVERNIDIVKTLSQRGIINSVCSKNDFVNAQSALKRADVWDYFVFPRIDWQPKGAMIRSIIESAQLRPESVMFIDDNPINLNEVRHYNPGLQVAGPEILDTLLADPRFQGKDDRELTRLKQYKVLETKEIDRTRFVDNENGFLHGSDIQISFHTDLMEEFDRVYELINRTNQLNYTKNRLPEDKEEARAFLKHELFSKPHIHTAYIKVSDKYGYYGIVGLYWTELSRGQGRIVKHFLFSCRTLNMGIEQFVYQKIGRPRIDVTGEVVADLNDPAVVDWISVVPDAERRGTIGGSPTKRICVRGACELEQLTHYLGHAFEIDREFPFPCRGWGVAMPAAQFFSIWPEFTKRKNRQLFSWIPGLPKRVAESRLITGNADLFVLSFSLEPQWGHYRYKETGIVVPLKLEDRGGQSIADLTKLSFAEVSAQTKIDLSERQWRWFRENFEYCGGFDLDRFTQNIRDLCGYLQGKSVAFVLLNSRHGKLTPFHKINAEMNEVVERETRILRTRELIRLDDLITGNQEVINAYHFRRTVYPRLAEAVRSVANGSSPERLQEMSRVTAVG